MIAMRAGRRGMGSFRWRMFGLNPMRGLDYEYHSLTHMAASAAP